MKFNILNRIKYYLLRWLLGDICKNSECNKCVLSYEIEVAGYKGTACREGDVIYQARNAWDLWED